MRALIGATAASFVLVAGGSLQVASASGLDVHGGIVEQRSGLPDLPSVADVEDPTADAPASVDAEPLPGQQSTASPELPLTPSESQPVPQQRPATEPQPAPDAGTPPAPQPDPEQDPQQDSGPADATQVPEPGSDQTPTP